MLTDAIKYTPCISDTEEMGLWQQGSGFVLVVVA